VFVTATEPQLYDDLYMRCDLWRWSRYDLDIDQLTTGCSFHQIHRHTEKHTRRNRHTPRHTCEAVHACTAERRQCRRSSSTSAANWSSSCIRDAPSCPVWTQRRPLATRTRHPVQLATRP